MGMAEKTGTRCWATFHGRGGALYCSSPCRQAAYRTREKTKRLRECRAIGEQCHQEMAPIKAGDSQSRPTMQRLLREQGIDLYDELIANGSMRCDV